MKKYFLLFILSVTIFFFHAIITKHAIYGDGNGYYSYTHALFFERSLNFDPIYKHLGNFPGTKFVFSRIFWDTKYADNAVIRNNPYTIGTGIFWLPSMAFISIVNSLFNLGIDKFSLIYELGPGLTGVILILAGLYFLEKYLLNFFSKPAVFWTILTVFFATNVFYYSSFEPALSHQPSFFLISFLLFWTYKFKPSLKNIFILGILSGLLAIVRMADSIILIPILFQAAKNHPSIKQFPIYLAGLLIAISPQITAQYLMYGSTLINPYLNGQNGIWQISFVNLYEHLFSPLRGLFLWSPILLIATFGLFKSRSKIFLISIFLLWLISSSWSGSLSAGYGQRHSFASIPLLSYGLAYVLNNWKLKKIFSFFLISSLINLNLLTTFYLHKDRLLEPGYITFKEFVALQVNNPFQVLKYLRTITGR